MEDQIKQTESEIAEPSFWQNNPDAQQVFNQLNRQKSTLATYDSCEAQAQEIKIILELLHEQEDDVPAHIGELQEWMGRFTQVIDTLEIQSLLSGKYDKFPCVFSINAGAGGTDAQDWAQMLIRMYQRWFEKKGFSVETVDHMLGEEAGIKSTTCLVSGPFAYGLLKAEIGIHRLVRLSPFNANSKRQTSFAAPERRNATNSVG